MRIDFDEAVKFIRGCTDVLILTHASPDGDTLGCGFGLCRSLRNSGVRANVVCADPIPKKYSFLTDFYEPAEFEPKTVIAVDVAAPSLLGGLFETVGRVDFCIDHHITNTNYADRLLLGEKSAAACEVVFKLLRKAELPVDEITAMCLYTGIATDTGCFKFENVTPVTHLIAAELCGYDFPMPIAKLNRWLFDIKSPSRIRAEALIHRNTELFCDGKCAVTSAELDEIKKEGLFSEDFDGIASLPMQIEGVSIAVTVREKEPGSFKISVRTDSSANASRLCERFGGGGHVRAAGCNMAGHLDDIKRRLAEACEEELSGGESGE